MEPYQVFILIVGILVILIIMIMLINRKISLLRKQAIQEKLQHHLPDGIFTRYHASSPFQIQIETENRVFVIKIIPFSINHELIITAPKSWCVNESPKAWKRSSTPELVPLVSGFMDYKPSFDKKTVKIALIYPGCHNITRYLNESDVELVSYSKQVYGIFFIRFHELDDYFTSLK